MQQITEIIMESLKSNLLWKYLNITIFSMLLSYYLLIIWKINHTWYYNLSLDLFLNCSYFWKNHCVKSARIRSYSGLHFPAYGLNTERYGISLRIQSKCGKIRTRITLNTDISHAIHDTWIRQSWEVMWLIKYIISPLAKYLQVPN